MNNIKYSTDELLKEKPKKLKGLEFIEDDGGLSICVNGVTIFADNYDLFYANNFIAINFYERKNKIAVVTTFSSNKHKKDEVVVVGCGFIVIETSYRIMGDAIN